MPQVVVKRWAWIVPTRKGDAEKRQSTDSYVSVRVENLAKHDYFSPPQSQVKQIFIQCASLKTITSEFLVMLKLDYIMSLKSL